MTWADRANTFLVQQQWLRIERPVVATGTEPTAGFRLDVLAGSDYRFTLPRNLFDSQLVNSTGSQNLYGVDPVQFYVNAYFPTLFRGTDFRVGQLVTPWGNESIEAPTTPLMSCAYAFNFGSPFTHVGAQVSTTFTPTWSRALHARQRQRRLLRPRPGTAFRRPNHLHRPEPAQRRQPGLDARPGEVQRRRPVRPGHQRPGNELAGRNNINVIDLVWAHRFNSVLSYTNETLFGYQTNVPGGVPGGLVRDGPRHRPLVRHGPLPQLRVQPARQRRPALGNFEDFQGQRTGFTGLYSVASAGLQFRPTKWLTIRPEVRFDYNAESRPFEDKHYLLTAGASSSCAGDEAEPRRPTAQMSKYSANS